MSDTCPTCGGEAFPSRGRFARFNFAEDPNTGRSEAVIMRFGCGHDAWISKELREKYGGKPTDPVIQSSTEEATP